MSKRVLVTGASGFLGAAVLRRMRTEHAAEGLCHRHAGEGLIPCDLRDADSLRSTLAATEPDVVIHCAAYREPDYCEEHPAEAEALNVEPLRQFQRLLAPAAHLIFVSTDYVFDGRNPPYEEDRPRNPLSVYGRTKMMAEDEIRDRPNSLALRVPVLVGAGRTLETSGYIGQLVTAVRAGVAREEDDVLMRFPTWVDDVAEAMAFLVERRLCGVCHYSGEQGATRYQSAVEVAGILGLPAAHLSPSRQVVARRATRPMNSQLSTRKIRGLGFSRFTPFAEVVRRVLAAAAGGTPRTP